MIIEFMVNKKGIFWYILSYLLINFFRKTKKVNISLFRILFHNLKQYFL